MVQPSQYPTLSGKDILRCTTFLNFICPSLLTTIIISRASGRTSTLQPYTPAFQSPIFLAVNEFLNLHHWATDSFSLPPLPKPDSQSKTPEKRHPTLSKTRQRFFAFLQSRTPADRRARRDVVFRELWPQILRPLRRTRYAKRFIKVATKSFGIQIPTGSFYRWNSAVGFEADVKKSVDCILSPQSIAKREVVGGEVGYLRFLAAEKRVLSWETVKLYRSTIRMFDGNPGHEYHNDAYLTAEYILKLEYRRLNQSREERINDLNSVIDELIQEIVVDFIEREQFTEDDISHLEVFSLEDIMEEMADVKMLIESFWKGDLGFCTTELAVKLLCIELFKEVSREDIESDEETLESALRRFWPVLEREVMTRPFFVEFDSWTKTEILQPRWSEALLELYASSDRP
ncbi:hypothetical protein HDV05_001599 [Chytridiales sp. JEL 0842]|nr:hypothetical protein HDV05_001599 [Chytridiales sp. JEL 0842]